MTRSKKLISILMLFAIMLMTCGVFGVAFARNKQTPTAEVEAVSTSTTFQKISTKEALAAVAINIARGVGSAASGNYELTTDLDLSGLLWTPIGTQANPFTGRFNGNGHTIKGNISLSDSSIWIPSSGTGYAGIFGYTSSAEIYDVVVGETIEISDPGITAANTGRLIGYAANTTLIDVYDATYVLSSGTRNLKTIGTADTCTIYDCDTFTYSGKTYMPSTSTLSGSNYVKYTKKTSYQFDIRTTKGTTAKGKSFLLMQNSADDVVYVKNNSGTMNNIMPVHLAITSSGSNKKVESDRYVVNLPQEDATDAASIGTAIFNGGLGKKLCGWYALGSSTLYNTSSALSSASLSSNILVPRVKKVTYNITINIPGQSAVTYNSTPYGTPWENIYKFNSSNKEVVTRLTKSGYDLVSVYKGSETYVSVDPKYDSPESGSNPNFVVTYPKGKRIMQWDDAPNGTADETISVTLETRWQGKPIVSNIVYSNSQDKGAEFGNIVEHSIAYTGASGAQTLTPSLKESESGTTIRTYTFCAPADITLSFTVGLKFGYKIAGATTNVGTVQLSSTNSVSDSSTGVATRYTYTISGLKPTTSTPAITFQLVREEISISVNAGDYDQIAVSENTTSGYTSVSGGSGSWTLKTRLGEKFKLTATPKEHYEYTGFSHSGFESISEVSGTTAAKVFNVNITSYEASTKSITITAKLMVFTLDLEYVAADCNDATKPTFTFDTDYTARESQIFKNVTYKDSFTISSAGNDYYENGIVTITGTNATLSGSNGAYILTNVEVGTTVKLKVTYAAKKFTASLDGKFADLSKTGTPSSGIVVSSVKAIQGVNGTAVATNTVLTISAVDSYKHHDTVNLNATFVGNAAKHYDFVGWFLSNGTYIDTKMSTTFTVPASNVTIYAVVKGKSLTLTVQNGTYVENHNGQVGEWFNTGKNVITTPTTSVTYTFSKPNDGSLSFSSITGYSYTGFLIIKDADKANIGDALTKGNAFKVPSAATINGYATFRDDFVRLLENTENASYKVFPYATQQTMTAHFTNDKSNRTFKDRTYYYDTDLDVADIITEYEKAGYTSTGWEVYNSSAYSIKIQELSGSGKLNLNSCFSSDGNVYLVRTYKANVYKVYFSKDSGVPQVKTESGNNVAKETNANAKVDDTVVNDYYYISVAFDTAFDMTTLPMFDNPGYYLDGFQVVSTQDKDKIWNSADGTKIFKFAHDVIVKPLFANGKYNVTINANGGTLKGALGSGTNKSVSLGTVGQTLGETELFKSTSEATLLTKLSELFNRAGFKATGLHFLTYNGSTYTYVKKLNYNDSLTPAYFGSAHFVSSTDKGKTWSTDITLYCRWEFDGTESLGLTAFESNFTGKALSPFDPKIRVGSTTYQWNTKGNALNTDEVTISEFGWYSLGDMMSGSGTKLESATAKTPSLIHVSQSGYYRVEYVLTDNKTVKATNFDPAKSKKLEYTSIATIKPVAAKYTGDNLPNEMLATVLKERLKANKSLILAITDSDAMINNIISATSASGVASAIGSDLDMRRYLTSLILVSDILVDENLATLYKNILAGTSDAAIVDTISSKTLAEHRTWLKNITEFKKYKGQIDTFNTALTPTLYAKIFDGTSDYFNQYATEIFALDFADGSTITKAVTATIVDGEGAAHSDVNVLDFTKQALEQGKALKLTLTLNDGFEPTDFTNVKSVNGEIIFEHSSVPNNVYGLIVAGVTSFNLNVPKGVEPESHTQVLTSNYDYTSKFSKIEATVEPENATAGVYSFFGAKGNRLVIKSYKLYVDNAKYYTITPGSSVQISKSENALPDLAADQLKNISLYVDGEYEIVSADTMPKTEISAQTLYASTDNTKLNIRLKEVNVKLKSVTFNNAGTEKTTNVSGNYVLETIGGAQKLITQIKGNNSQTTTIYLSEYVTKLTFEIADVGNGVFIGVYETKDENGYYERILKNSSPLNASSAEYAVTKGELPATIGAIFTEATHITHAWISDGTIKTSDEFGDEFDRYVNFKGSYTIPLDDMYEKFFPDQNATTRAYVFSDWQSEGLTASGNEITNNSTYLNATLTATKSLAIPTLNKDALTINDYATARYVSATDLLTQTSASVQNLDQSLVYTYKIYKQNDGSAESEQSHIAWTTKSSGKYRIEIVVSDNNNNYKTQKSDGAKNVLTLTLKKTPLELALGENPYTFGYNRTDHKGEVQATLSSAAFAKPETRPLFAEHSAGFGSLFDIILKKGDFASDKIQDAGTYSITVTLKNGSITGGFEEENFEDVFSFNGTTFEGIKVNQAVIALKDSDIKTDYSKEVGDEDPSLTFIHNTIYGEAVEITLERQKGDDSEKVGRYPYVNATVDNPNYVATVTDLVNKQFEIKKSVYGIMATINADPYQVEYNGDQDYSAALVYDPSDNQWKIKIYNFGGEEHSYTLALSLKGSNGRELKVDKNTLAGMQITLDGNVKDVKDYYFTINKDGLTEYSDFEFTKTPIAIKVYQRKISFEYVTKEFDNTLNFTYHTDGTDNDGIDARVDRVVPGDSLTITGVFGGIFGRTVLNSIRIVDNNNYTIDRSFQGANIIISSKQIAIEGLGGDSLAFTYGEVDSSNKQILDKVMLTLNGSQQINGTDISNYVTKRIEFSQIDVYNGSFLKANEGGYQATIKLTSRFFNVENITKTITIVVNKKTIDVNDEIVPDFSKFAKAQDPDLAFTYFTELSERVTIRLSRVAGDDVVEGGYSYTSAEIYDYGTENLSGNYEALFNVKNKKFIVKAIESGITATVKGETYSTEYNGVQTIKSNLEYDDAQKTYVIKLYQNTIGGELLASYTLDLNFTSSLEPPYDFEIDKDTLKDITISIEETEIKDVGEYHFKISGNLSNFEGEFTLDGNPAAFIITPRVLAFNGAVTKQFDNTSVFTYHVNGDNAGLSATVDNLLIGESFDITGSFGGLFGKVGLAGLSVNDSNYYIAPTYADATIIKSEKKVKIEIAGYTDKLTYVYGDVDKDFTNIRGIIKLTIDSDVDTLNGRKISEFVSVEFDGINDADFTSIDRLKAKTDDYSFTIKLTSEYFDASATQTIIVHVGKLDQTVEDEDLTGIKDSKFVGESDPSFAFTYHTSLGEDISATLTRDMGVDYEKVGTYPFKSALTSDTNYELHLGSITKRFTINKSNDALTATISDKIHTLTYGDNNGVNITPSLEFDGDKWVIKLTQGSEIVATYALKLALEGSDAQLTPNKYTLDGISVKLDKDIVKNAGEYRFVLTGGLKQYSDLTFTNDLAIVVNKKEITLSNVEKEFDNTRAFTYHTNGSENDGIKATVSKTVYDDVVTISGEFSDVFGTGLTLTIDVDNDNYFVQEQITASIVASTKQVTIEVEGAEEDGLSFEYGVIDESLSEILSKIILKVDGNDNINGGAIKDFVQVSLNGLNSESDFSSSGKLKVKDVGNYSITISLTSPSGQFINFDTKTLTITITKKEVKITPESDITKVFDNSKAVAQEFTIEGIELNDLVTIKSALYASAEPSDSIAIEFTIDGADKDNYKITNLYSIFGAIKEKSLEVRFVVDPSEDGEGAKVSVNGKRGVTFVDGEHAAQKPSVNFEMPYADKSEGFEKLGEPNKKRGYNFSGWFYESDSGYVKVDEESLYNYLIDHITDEFVTLYASYDIETYKVEIVLGEGGESYTVSPENDRVDESGANKIYTYDYYSTIEIVGVAKSGYVARNSPITIEHLNNNLIGPQAQVLEFSSVSVQFTIRILRGDLYQRAGHTNLINFINKGSFYEWKRGLDGQATLTVAYNVLSSLSLSDLLPTIEIEGYNLIDGGKWNSGVNSFITSEITNVQTGLVDKVNDNFHEQINVELTLDKSSLDGKPHTITLNAGAGQFDDEQSIKQVQVKYGEIINVSGFEKPARVGYEFKGWTYLGEDFNDETDYLYGYDENITLYAVWEVQSYILSISLTKATVIVKDAEGRVVSNYNNEENKYNLYYDVAYTIEVTADDGYEIKAGSWGRDASQHYNVTSIDGDYSRIRLTNLSQDDTFGIKAFARDNRLTINYDERLLSSITVSGENEIQKTDGYYIIKTDEVITISIATTIGHSVKEATVTMGNANLERKGDVWELTGFTSDIAIMFILGADDVTATVYVDEGVEAITISENGKDIRREEGYYLITTTVDRAFKINIKLNAGYKLKLFAMDEHGYSHSHKENLDANDVYTVVVTISEFSTDFAVTIETEKREYEMTAKVVVTGGEKEILPTDFTALVNGSASAQVLFMSTAHFTTQTSLAGYIFIGWFEGDLTGGVDGIDLNGGYKDKDFNYVVNNPKNTTFTAVWSLGLFTVTAEVGEGKGTIIIDDVVVADGTQTFRVEIVLGSTITLTAVPAEGYTVKNWLLDGDVYPQATGEVLELKIDERDYNFVVNFEPLPVKVAVQSKVSINGELKDADNNETSSHGLIKWAYTAEELEGGGGNVDIMNIPSTTDRDVYFIVTVKEGYEFDNFYVVDEEDTSAPIDPVRNKDGIYRLTGLVGNVETKQYNFYARFVATVGNFTIKFLNEKNEQIDAGLISVKETRFLSVQSNNNSTVHVSAVTGTGFEANVSINIGYKFAETPVSLIGNNAGLNAEQPVKNGNVSTSGHSYKLTFLVVNVVGGENSESEINIYVISEIYKVRLNATGIWDSPKDYQVMLGGYIENLVPEEIIPIKEDYQFEGYYTYIDGAGIKYIDKTGAQIRPWYESGYTYNGERYTRSTNVDDDGYINLYAAFIIKKTEINVQVTPDQLKNTEPYNLRIKNLIQNFNDSATWTKDGGEFDYIAEVLFKTAVTIEAYNHYNGYKFDRWQIYGILQDGTEGSPYLEDSAVLRQPRIENLMHDGYVKLYVKALYLANIAVEANDNEGGDVWFTIEGDETGKYTNEYLQNAKVTLHAQANAGYRFVKWQNLTTNEEFSQADLELSAELVPSTYRAYFDGMTVSVEVLIPSDTTHGQINKVTYYHAGALAGEFTKNETRFAGVAQVGDIINIEVTVDRYYTINWDNENVHLNGNNYEYKVAYNNGITTILTPAVEQEHCQVELRVALQDVNNASEALLAGAVLYQRPYEEDWNQLKEIAEQFASFAGAKMLMNIDVAPNYKLASVSIQVPGLSESYTDLTATYASGIELVAPDGELHDAFTITITFVRDMWIDTVDAEHVLSGSGTNSNPYMINSIEDLVYMAYMINVESVASYASASYKLGANINLAGKFWSPMGTISNKFNGKFDYGAHSVTNITLTTEALNEEHHYNGLFGYITERAKIIEQNEELIIALAIVGSLLLLIIILLIIFIIWRKKRKNQIEHLQNG